MSIKPEADVQDWFDIGKYEFIMETHYHCDPQFELEGEYEHKCPNPADSNEVNPCASCVYDADYYDSRWNLEPPTCTQTGVKKLFEITVVVAAIADEPANVVLNGPGRDSGNSVQQEVNFEKIVANFNLKDNN